MSRDKPENYSSTSNTVLEISYSQPGQDAPVSHSLPLITPDNDENGGTGPLHAGNAHAIPFQEREEHLAAAMQWLEGEGPAPSVRIITGRAGQGKTRLGMEIAARARKRGWLAGFLPAGGPDLFPATEFRTVWHQPTLVIIDNAAARTTQVRTWLTAVLRQKPGAHPLRFLLLERTGLDDLWLDSIFGATEAGSPLPAAALPATRWPILGPLASAHARFAVFAAAYRAAGGSDLPADAARRLAPRLKALGTGHATLFPILFGLVAACDGLLEARRLAASTLLARAAALHVAYLEQAWPTNPSVPEDLYPVLPCLAAASQICGGLEADCIRPAVQAAAGQDIPATDEALHALHALPGMTEGGAAGLPGLLTEAVCIHLAHPLPAARWTGLLETLMAHPSMVTRLATGIARLCQNPGLYPPGLPVMWLRHLGPARLHDRATLSCLAIQMPLHPPTIGTVALEATERLVTLLRGQPPSSPHAPLAWALAALFRRNAALFHQDAALDCARQVVAIHTTLAQVSPVAFDPALAAGLDALAAYANSLHHHDEALTAARRAVTLYTRLATQDSACLPLRARSLRILADSRCGLKQYGQAEQAVRRALDIQTLLPGTDGTDHDAALAESHLVLSACQAGQQQHEDAVENALQAVILYTPLARQDPDTGLPGLARALRQVASMQYALKRHEEALKSLEESFSLHTLLEERDTGDYRPQIGASLEMLSLFQNAVGRHAASLHSIMEAVARYRVLAAENPRAFRPMLSDLLLRLGLRYVTLEPPRLAESVQATREAVDELALLARDNPRRFTPKLVENRVLLAKRLEENGEDDAAASTLWAAIDQLLALTREDAATFHQPLLETTEILGELFKRHGRMEEMEQLMQALIPLQRELAAHTPDDDGQRELLAALLRESAASALQRGHYARARGFYTECLELLEACAASSPEPFLNDIAYTMGSLSDLLARPEQQAERLALLRSSLPRLESLTRLHPQTFIAPFMSCLEQVARLLVDDGQPEQALAVTERAVPFHQAVLDVGLEHGRNATVPEKFAQLLTVRLRALEAPGHEEEVLRTIGQIMALYATLVEHGRIFYRWFLARAMTGLAARQKRMGAGKSALRTCQKSVALFRVFMATTEEEFLPGCPDVACARPDFAQALLEQARVQESFSCHAAARESIMEAVALLKDVTADDPAEGRLPLTEALAMLTALPPASGAPAGEALASLRHVVAIYHGLDGQHPHLFVPELAEALIALCAAQLQAQPPLWSSALDSAREATALYTSLYETGPEQYRAPLADSQYRLFVCLNGLEQIDRAMESLKLALVQYRHLAARRPQEFRAPLARCLLDLALYHVIYKQYETALQTAHEASALYTDLAQSDRETYQPVLKEIRDLQATIRKKLHR
ncbi:hypothetical protein [Komagataeibacter rhaeticus]|uniref:Novel STAND NTPase 5 domain-containing protein n=1 Tax=Komagataeibacter rhaeticus TaxID=215221 RepID=A0A858JIC6_9PROT|nr:hypothetical protein [Komagataeibacter rhaeticus]ATU73069.1 hypothetical protein CT154_09715 [Komagataeibacter xylinus]QIP35182.1 hypothetical protein GWK63_06635 [Komagataeibacter rhaeticus]QOC47743.1 hypothetical protein ICJ78_06690 [Komagataeibacter rhaeticus]WPP22892.1 hypothetical protein SCD25_05240 [Komagataeibacter rhaeticus]